MPRSTSVLQSWVNVPLDPLLQVTDVRVCDVIRELAHILLQRSIHEIEAAEEESRMVIRGRDLKPLVVAPLRVHDEVREGFMKGSNRVTDIFMEDEERLNRRQKGEYVVRIEAEECRDRGRRKGICGEDHGTKDRLDLGVAIRIVVVAKGLPKDRCIE